MFSFLGLDFALAQSLLSPWSSCFEWDCLPWFLQREYGNCIWLSEDLDHRKDGIYSVGTVRTLLAFEVGFSALP